MLLGEAYDWERIFKAGSPHWGIGYVDFVSCLWRGCNVADPCEGLILVVCQFLCKWSIWSKANSQCALTFKSFSPGYEGGGGLTFQRSSGGLLLGCQWSGSWLGSHGESIAIGLGNKNISGVPVHLYYYLVGAPIPVLLFVWRRWGLSLRWRGDASKPQAGINEVSLAWMSGGAGVVWTSDMEPSSVGLNWL